MHSRFEALAGAIALGEAGDDQRREYREHIVSCPECLHSLGGEHEIERTAQTVADARESEVWTPDLIRTVGLRVRRRSGRIRFAVSCIAIALVAAFAVRLLGATGIAKLSPALSAPLVIGAGNARIVVGGPPPELPASKPAAPAPAPQRLVVTHNVVQMARTPVTAAPIISMHAPAKHAPPTEIAAVTVHPDPPLTEATQQDVPVWRRGDEAASWRTIAKTTTTSLSESAPQMASVTRPIQIAAAYTTRDAAPIGGATAINPQPTAIAYQENAEGTTVFQVLIDERGVPTKCIVTKPAGYPVLDEAVCRAAMKARYTPKTVDGRAVPGTYTDAFTFHVTDNGGEFPRPIQ